jgi:hypothetical protein
MKISCHHQSLDSGPLYMPPPRSSSEHLSVSTALSKAGGSASQPVSECMERTTRVAQRQMVSTV